MHGAWTSGARPSVAGTLTLKQCSRVHQNTSFLFTRLKNFLEMGAQPSPRSHPQRQRENRLSHPLRSAPWALNPWPPVRSPKYVTQSHTGVACPRPLRDGGHSRTRTPRTVNRKSDALPIARPRHQRTSPFQFNDDLIAGYVRRGRIVLTSSKGLRVSQEEIFTQKTIAISFSTTFALQMCDRNYPRKFKSMLLLL